MLDYPWRLGQPDDYLHLLAALLPIEKQMTPTTHQRHAFGSDGICFHCGAVRWKYLKQRRLDGLARKKAADAIRRAKK